MRRRKAGAGSIATTSRPGSFKVSGSRTGSKPPPTRHPQKPKPSPPEPSGHHQNSAITPLQSRAVGVHETDLAAWRDVVLSQRSNAGQVNTTQQSTDVHELTPPVTQYLSASRRSAETPPQSDTGQPLEVTPRMTLKATATVPTKNLSAESPSRARAAKRRRASTPRRDAGSRRYIHR
jgi:hypothetical protein